jgi:hypothetical protein
VCDQRESRKRQTEDESKTEDDHKSERDFSEVGINAVKQSNGKVKVKVPSEFREITQKADPIFDLIQERM